MDVLELLNGELREHDFTLKEAMRYLYLRSCELFTYDARYDFLDLFPDELEIKKDFRNRMIDLREVEDNRIICTTYAREVFSKIVQELLGFETHVLGCRHSYVKFYDGECWWKADATISSDLARVKMSLSTRGYLPILTDSNYADQLRKVDQKIAYIHTFYEDEKLLTERSRMFHHFKSQYNTFFKKLSLFFLEERETAKRKDDLILSSWKMIQELLNQYHLEGFTDFEFAISYLEHIFLGCADSFCSNTTSLYQILANGDWEFINIYPVELSNDTLYYMLSGNDGNLSFQEITRSDALHYKDVLDGKRKHLIRS